TESGMISRLTNRAACHDEGTAMKRWLIIIVAGLLVIGVIAVSSGFYWPFSSHRDVLILPGTFEVHELRLGSKISGRVKEVYIREGDIVEEGKPLLLFDVPELKAQRDQLAARLASAQAEYQKARVGPRQLEIDEAEWAMKSAEARRQRMENGWRIEEIKQA